MSRIPWDAWVATYFAGVAGGVALTLLVQMLTRGGAQ